MHQGVDFTRRDALDDTSQNRPGALRFVPLAHVEFDDAVADVWAGCGHFVGGPDVAPSELDETSALGETGQARGDETLARQAVHDDVHARPVGSLQHPLAEFRGAAVEDVRYPERAQEITLRCARRGDHFRPGGAREFDGRQSEAARAGVDQHPVAGLEIGRLECQGSRHEDARHGGERRRRHP